jgi:hypothetical protein
VLVQVCIQFLVLGILRPVQIQTQQLQQGKQELLRILLPVPREPWLFVGDCLLQVGGGLGTIRGGLHQLHQFPVGDGDPAGGIHLPVVLVVQEVVIEPGKVQHALQD